MSTSSGDDRDVWEKIDDINLIIYEEQIEGLVDVRHGRLNDKDICVKSVKEGVLSPKEVEYLILCRSVPNVIQFSFKATHEGYEHLVFEPYQYTLETFLLEHKDLLLHDGFPTALLFKLIRDMIKGLFNIHRLRLIHGNITPWNIMVVESHEDNNDRKYIAKICDLAMSRRIEQRNGNLHQRRRITLPDDTRDYFWPAPEQRDRNMLQGQKLDVFNLSCVIAYCIIGEHPFGEEDQCRLDNIKNNNDDDELPNHPELINLIKSMVKRNKRVSINEVMSHPLFWDLTRQIQFLELASDFIQGHPDSRNSLDSKTEEILGDNRDWRVRAGNAAIWSSVDRGPLGKIMLLPEDDPNATHIMIATGTGVAPFRGYLRRMFMEAVPTFKFGGLAWLFLGVANSDSLLYDDEFSKYLKDYPDNFRYDRALSREQKNKNGGKMYVQDKIEEYSDEIFKLLDNGAHIYFCGLKGMMPGIQETLKRVAEQRGESWEQKLSQLKKNKQWHVEVY